MTLVYLASPNTQQLAEHVSGMPVLLSFPLWTPMLDRYQQTFRRILIDSGVLGMGAALERSRGRMGRTGRHWWRLAALAEELRTRRVPDFP